MRDLLEFQYLLQIRRVRKYFHDAAVIGTEEFLEHQASYELWLRELLGTLEVTKGRQGALRRRVGAMGNHFSV